METVTLKYIYEGEVQSVEIEVLAVKGFDENEEWELFPPLQRTLLNGTIIERVVGARKVITIDFGVAEDSEKREALFHFLRCPERSIVYHNIEKNVAIDGIESYANECVDGYENAKRYVVRVKERGIT
jgi:hypothetical protein